MKTPTLMATMIAVLLSGPSVASESENTTIHPPRLEQLQQLQGSLSALRSALGRIGKEKGRDFYTDPIIKKAYSLERSAKALIAKKELRLAQQQLNQGMNIVKTAISTLRNQETLIRSLNLDTPQDEYLYEHQRYKGYCKLVDLLIKNRANKTVIALRQQAQIIANAAEQHASRQLFSEALKALEQSNRLLVQAFNRSGVFIPG